MRADRAHYFARTVVSFRFDPLTVVCLDSLGVSHQLSRNGRPRSPEDTSSTLVLDCARDVRARAIRHRGRRAVRGCQRGQECAGACRGVRHDHTLFARRIELRIVRRASADWSYPAHGSSPATRRTPNRHRREIRAPLGLSRSILGSLLARTSRPARALIGGRLRGPLCHITGHPRTNSRVPVLPELTPIQS